jgi:hypothetical protein
LHESGHKVTTDRGVRVADGGVRVGNDRFRVLALTLLAFVPPILWFVHERVIRLPTTTPLILMNYDAFAWFAAYRAASSARRSRTSISITALVVMTFAGLVLSGIYLLTLVGLCGPTVLVFHCQA